MAAGLTVNTTMCLGTYPGNPWLEDVRKVLDAAIRDVGDADSRVTRVLMLAQQADLPPRGCIEEVRRRLSELGISMAGASASTMEIAGDFHEIGLSFFKIGKVSSEWNREIMECTSEPDWSSISKDLGDLLREVSSLASYMVDHHTIAMNLKEKVASYKERPKPKGEARREMFAEARLEIGALLKMMEEETGILDQRAAQFKKEIPLAFDREGIFYPEKVSIGSLRAALTTFFSIRGQVQHLNQLLKAVDQKWELRAKKRDLERDIRVLVEEGKIIVRMG